MKEFAGVEGFLFGCDPEMFVTNPEGELVSAYGLIPGTKAEPFKVEHGAVQVDGLAAEFNIDPADNWSDFNRNIVSVVKQLKAMLPKGHGLKIAPAVHFSQSVMDAQPDEAKILGCDPDFNAWKDGEVNPTPETANDPLLRTAAGHIHVGWTTDIPPTDDLHGIHCRDLVRQLDWMLGSWSVRQDSDVTRRQLYGRAGAYRPKPYGVEYRVLSNFWIKDKQSRLNVWNRLQMAINKMAKMEYSKKYGEYGGWNEDIQTLINTADKTVQEKIETMFYKPVVRI